MLLIYFNMDDVGVNDFMLTFDNNSLVQYMFDEVFVFLGFHLVHDVG